MGDCQRCSAKLIVNGNGSLPKPFQKPDHQLLHCPHKWSPVKFRDIYTAYNTLPGGLNFINVERHKSSDQYNVFVSGYVVQPLHS